jgi:hypothetical protein
MDRILFGDNQFFGINHLSEEKGRQQLMRFQKSEAVIDVLQAALQEGVGGFMCTTHDAIAKIADDVRVRPDSWQGFHFYPGMPYAHKYANAVTEYGYFDALKRFLPEGGLVDTFLRGSKAVVTRDLESMMTLLVDAEMKMFRGLNTPVIFLQNVVTDLILGLGITRAFSLFSEYVQQKYNAEAGFITMNLPKLLPVLQEAGLKAPIVCANVNKIAFRMSGGIDSYREAAQTYSARVIAMSVLASGRLPAREAIEWVVNERYVESILFGASSRANIRQTVSLIREFDDAKARKAA